MGRFNGFEREVIKGLKKESIKKAFLALLMILFVQIMMVFVLPYLGYHVSLLINSIVTSLSTVIPLFVWDISHDMRIAKITNKVYELEERQFQIEEQVKEITEGKL